MYVSGCGECITEHSLSYESTLLLSVCTALEPRGSLMYCTAKFKLIFNKTGNVHVNVTLRLVCETILAAKNITYSESVCVALGMQHAMRMPHIANCGLPGSTEFS